MRILYVLQGLPNSGKASFIKENRLDPYTIHLNQIKSMLSNPTDRLVDHHFEQLLTDKLHSQLNQTLYSMVRFRMQNRQTTIIDGDNIKIDIVKPLIKLAHKYLYQVKFVQVGTELSLNELQYRNQQQNIKKISTQKISELYYSFHKFNDQNIPILSTNEMLNDLSVSYNDISNYESFQVIGDVHSSASTLKEMLKDFSNKRLYIFCGDYFDRGIEHIETFKMIQKLMTKSNTIFLTGNHDYHIMQYLYHIKKDNVPDLFDHQDILTGKLFKEDTLPTLLDAGVTVDELKEFVHNLIDVYAFSFHNINFIASHAGLNNEQINMMQRFKLQNSDFFVKGIGDYSYDIDSVYQAKWIKNNIEPIQFHGHRNAFLHPIFRYIDSNRYPESYLPMYNLEQKVERGGKLGSVIVNYKNDQFSVVSASVKTVKYDQKRPVFDENSISGDVQTLYKANKNYQFKAIDDSINRFSLKNKVYTLKDFYNEKINADLFLMDESEHVVLRSEKYSYNFQNLDKETKDKIIHDFSISTLYPLYVQNKVENVTVFISYIKNRDQLLIDYNDSNINHQKMALKNIEKVLSDHQQSLENIKEFFKNQSDPYTLIFKVVSNNDFINSSKSVQDNVYIDGRIINTDYSWIENVSSAFYKTFPFFIQFKEFLVDTSIYEHSKDVKNYVENYIQELINQKNEVGYYLYRKDKEKIFIETLWYNRRQQFKTLLEKYFNAYRNGNDISQNLMKSKQFDQDIKDLLIEFVQNKTFLQLEKEIVFNKANVLDINQTIALNRKLNNKI